MLMLVGRCCSCVHVFVRQQKQRQRQRQKQRQRQRAACTREPQNRNVRQVCPAFTEHLHTHIQELNALSNVWCTFFHVPNTPGHVVASLTVLIIVSTSNIPAKRQESEWEAWMVLLVLW